jgi:hypothetical protein
MLLVPTIATQHAWVQPPWVLSDTLALVMLVAATAGLYLLTFHFAEQLRRDYAQ